MFGNVTALEEWHVTGGIQELKHDARMLQAWRLVFSEPPARRLACPLYVQAMQLAGSVRA